MQRPGYERFALVSNPFHDLASESLSEIEVYHVNQEADEAIERMKQEVLEKSRKAFVVIVGPLGSGKTQRLRVTAGQAEAVGAFAHYLNLGEAPPDPVSAIAEALSEAAVKRKLVKGFSPPRWSKDLQAIAKGKVLNPETAGRTLAEALNALAPSYLLMNDVDALHGAVEERTLHTLLAMVSHIQNGVMVAMTCQQPHFAKLNQRAGPLMSRVNRVLELRGLTDEEAELMLAKRMAGRRLIEDLDPVYPFTKPAVAEINRAAAGSPRRVLQLADLVLDVAVKDRAFQVGPELVTAALGRAGAILEHKPVTTAVPRTAQPVQPMPVRPQPLTAAPVRPVQPIAAQPVKAAPAPVNGAAFAPQPARPAAPAVTAAPVAPAPRPTAPPVQPKAAAPQPGVNGAAPKAPVPQPAGAAPPKAAGPAATPALAAQSPVPAAAPGTNGATPKAAPPAAAATPPAPVPPKATGPKA